MLSIRFRPFTLSLLGLSMLAAAPLFAQVAGAKNVVINQIQPDQGDGQGLSVELYNYGPDQVMTNWHLEFELDNGGSTTPSGFLFPSGYMLPRHGFAVVHWAAGTNGAVHLYRGAGAQSLTPDGELRLCATVCPTGGIGVDYVLWGAPSPTNLPPAIMWTGSVSYGSGAAQGYLQRSRDLNTRDAGDWTVLQQTADAALNPGQRGTRRHGRVMINEVYPGNGCGGSIWVELYNPNPFTISLNNTALLTYNSSGTVCQNQSLSGTLAAGGATAFNISGCANWRTNGIGEVILSDLAGEGWDYMSFGNPATRHVPADLRWTGPDPAGNTVIYRTDDLDGDNGLDWSVSGSCATPTQNALNPGQKGARVYDEIGGELNNFGYAYPSVPGRGNQFNVTTPFFLHEWKFRAQPLASAGTYLAIYQQNGANWNRIYQKALGSQTADGIFSTGAANLSIPVGVYRFMFYNGANFNVWSTPNPAEPFSWGTYQGVANEAASSYPPPATTPMGAYNAAGAPIQQYFLTDAMPAITTTSPLAPCDTGVSCTRTFAATAVAPLSWQFTGPAIPGLTFNGSTGTLTGYPTAAATYSFNISVTDGNGMVDSRPFTLVVNFLYGPLSVTTATVPGATQNLLYNAPLAATGGDGNYTWALISGALPNGMAVAATGAVYGQPFQLGTYPFTVRVTDGQGLSATRALSLTVTNALHIVNSSLPTGYPGVNYPATTILAAGGTIPYAYALDATSDPLPAGISFASGTLSGKPTAKGTANLVFRATDGVSAFVLKTLPLSVTDAPPLVQWEGRGLYGGDTTILAASPNFTTDSTAFATGQLFEHYRSDDGGATWVRRPVATAGMSNPVDRLVLSPAFNSGGATAAQRTIFAQSDVLGVYRSTDRGDSFIARNIGLPLAQGVGGLAISPNYASDGRLWIASTNTAPFPDVIDLYTTTNGGDSWSYLSSISDPSYNLRGGRLFVSPSYATDATLFAVFAFGVGGTMYKRSTDGGLSWGSVGGPAITSCGTTAAGFRTLVLSPNFAVDHTLFGEDACGVISRSVDSGATYVTLAQRGVSLAMLARPGQTPLVYLKNGSTLYGLSVSDNYGESFTPVYAGGLRSSFSFNGVQQRINALAPLRRADGTVYLLAANDKGVDGSFDGGASFNPRERGIAALNVSNNGYGFSLRGSNGNLVATNVDHWLYSRDGGQRWVRRLPPWPADAQGILPNVNAADIATGGSGASLVLLAGNDQLFQSVDGGLNFTAATGLSDFVYDITHVGSGVTVFAGGGTQIYKSGNSGVSFTALTGLSANDTCTPGGGDQVYSVTVSPNYASDSTVFAGTSTPCKSTNGGSTWAAIAGLSATGARITPSTTFNQNAASNANNAWTLFAGSGSGVMRSLDRGATWSAATGLPAISLQWLVTVSPNQAADSRVFAFSDAGVYLSVNNGAAFAPLGGADLLYSRPVSGVEFTGGAATAVAATRGGGLWRSVDGGNTFSPVAEYQFLSDKVNALAAVPITTPFAEFVTQRNAPHAPSATALQQGSLLAATSDSGIFISNDNGATFDIFSSGLGTYTDTRALVVPSSAGGNPLALAFDPASSAVGQVFRFNGSAWAPTSLVTGGYNRLDEAGSALYATRLDGVTQRSGDGGTTWLPIDAGQTNIANVSYNNASGPTALTAPGDGAKPPAAQSAITATYWSVTTTAGARYTDTPTSTWYAAPGTNDYTLPVLSGAVNNRYTTVQALGINPASGGREVLAGSTGGLYLTRDGGSTWRKVSGPGSGLEASSGNFSAMLPTVTAFSTTDVLVGATGSTTGGVYLSGDGGEHWTQINQGFDPSSLNISTLAITSCNGCPVQYYSGTYGSGVYTRTVAVVAPPAVSGWYFGSTAPGCGTATNCATAGAACGPEEGGQPFKLCGSGFQAAPVVEFDGVSAAGCSASTSAVITCTGTPAHIPGNAVVRVRNTDTRRGAMVPAYTYQAGAPRVVNSLRVAKSGTDANLTWSCAGCSVAAPARVTRSQNAPFTLYLEQYNGGAAGSWTNTGALAPTANPSYFWVVE